MSSPLQSILEKYINTHDFYDTCTISFLTYSHLVLVYIITNIPRMRVTFASFSWKSILQSSQFCMNTCKLWIRKSNVKLSYTVVLLPQFPILMSTYWNALFYLCCLWLVYIELKKKKRMTAVFLWKRKVFSLRH